NILESLDVEIKEVVISDLIEGTFYAKIYLDIYEYGSKEIDSRPSDAVALALRVDAPIYVDEEVMKEAGVVSEEQEIRKEKNQRKVETLVTLQNQLQKAIESENYEKAAELRDKIKMLEKNRGKKSR
ncbi:MAG: bifunctional nuclease domain-containing protein, partial [Fidelibacterota bacterium]